MLNFAIKSKIQVKLARQERATKAIKGFEMNIDNRHFLYIIVGMKMLLCGIGNKDRGDDGFGAYIVENIQESNYLRKIDCTLYPENYLNKIVSENPDLIIFLDTIRRQGSQNILLRNGEILENNPISISTHNLPFSAIYEYLKANTQAEIWFLGVRPTSFEEMSETTKTMAHKVINALNFLDKQEKLNIIEIYETLSTTLK